MAAPKTENLAANAARAVAKALRESRSEWQLADRVEDLGSSASLVIQSGSRRVPGDDWRKVDTLRKVRLNFSKEQQ
jgi:hypothetical protein